MNNLFPLLEAERNFLKTSKVLILECLKNKNVNFLDEDSVFSEAFKIKDKFWFFVSKFKKKFYVYSVKYSVKDKGKVRRYFTFDLEDGVFLDDDFDVKFLFEVFNTFNCFKENSKFDTLKSFYEEFLFYKKRL